MFYQMHYIYLQYKRILSDEVFDMEMFVIFIESIYISHIPCFLSAVHPSGSSIHQPSPGFYTRDRPSGRRCLLARTACCWIGPMLYGMKTGGRESMSCAWNRIQSSSRRIPRIRFESSWPAPFPPRRMCWVAWRLCIYTCDFSVLSNPWAFWTCGKLVVVSMVFLPRVVYFVPGECQFILYPICFYRPSDSLTNLNWYELMNY